MSRLILGSEDEIELFIKNMGIPLSVIPILWFINDGMYVTLKPFIDGFPSDFNVWKIAVNVFFIIDYPSDSI